MKMYGNLMKIKDTLLELPTRLMLSYRTWGVNILYISLLCGIYS